MRRLAIIDVDSGWQPFVSEDGLVTVVANGEIYNHVELRSDLASRGHRFGSASDCETILHLYEDYGRDCVRHLRGMFAFAVIDNRSGKLFLARDRMGEKPLLIAEGDGWLAFCSELVGLVGGRVVPVDVDPEVVSSFYRWGFVPEPVTPLRGVTKLPAGSHLTVDLATGSRYQETYWAIEDAPALKDEPVSRIRAEFEDLSRIISRSDRPIAVGLSAGVDSSAVLAMTARFASQPVMAVSIGYEGRQFQDESALAGKFARSLGVPHHRVELSVRRIVAEFPQMCIRRDEPFADIAGSSLYALAEASRELGAPVLMSGLGGDELFWGYSWHRKCVHDSLRARRARQGNAALLSYLEITPPPVSLVGATNWVLDFFGIRASLRERARDLEAHPDQLVFWDSRRDFQEAQQAIGRIAGWALPCDRANAAAMFTGSSLWERLEVSLTSLICQTYLLSNGLAQTDRLTMACGVEARVPLVDYKLAEVVVGLRKCHSDHLLKEKAWLRAALRGIVPQEVMNRRKRGFTPPWRSWTAALMRAYGDDLRDGELVERGLLSRAGAAFVARSTDRLGRPVPLAHASLVLEQWVRGLKAAAARGRPDYEREPELPTRRVES
jgi:asparagine synthase (glutamine-hydrolysing)